jgi:hypothetical protein
MPVLSFSPKLPTTNRCASGLWVRPYEMFTGQVDIDGRTQPRFEFVG